MAGVRFHSLLSLGKHACAVHTAKLEEALRRLLTAPDEEAIHDVRVACRRLGVALQILEPLYQKSGLKRVRKRVKTLMKALSAVRDTEVLGERCRASGETVARTVQAKASAAGALRLAELFEAQVELGRLGAVAVAVQGHFSRLPQELRRAVDPPALHGGKVRRFPLVRLEEYAGRILRERYAEIEALGATARSSSAELHELRIAFKKLRYAAEFFVEGLPEARIIPIVKLAQKFQEVLGDLHDADVTLEVFHAWHVPGEHGSWSGSLPLVAKTVVPVPAPETTAAAVARFHVLAGGVNRVMHEARLEQKRLRGQFVTMWTARNRLVLKSMVEEMDQPASRLMPALRVQRQVKSRSTISSKS